MPELLSPAGNFEKLKAALLYGADAVYLAGTRFGMRSAADNFSDEELYAAADCFVMPSLREGLSRSIMETMSSGLPCVVSKIRGNVDMVIDGEGGFLCPPTDTNAFAEAFSQLVENDALKDRMKNFNLEKIKEFDSSVVTVEMKKVYSETFL